MARAKRHHFVPKALQRAFADGNEQLWYSERDSNRAYGVPEQRNIHSTFQERDFYTVLDRNGPTDRVGRNFYGPIDDHLAKLLAELGDIFRSGGLPVIEGEPLESLHNLILVLLRRTPAFFKGHSEVDLGRNVVSQATAVMHGAKRVSPQMLDSRLSDERLLRRLGRTVRVKAQTFDPMELMKYMREFSIRWAVSAGKHSFLLGDLIVYRVGNGGMNGFDNPQPELWFPISPKRALVLVRDDAGRVPPIVDVGRDWMREFNEFVVSESDRIASSEKSLISSLLRSKP